MPFQPDQANLNSRPQINIRIAQEIAPIIEHMVGDGRSFIDPECVIWDPAVAQEVYDRLEKDPIIGNSMTQWEKLDIQLQGASREVVLMVAELAFLREHPLGNLLPSTRFDHIHGVLAHLGDETEIPESMRSWLSRPKGQAGMIGGSNYNRDMWLHVGWIARFSTALRALPEAKRRALLKDPVALQELMMSVPAGRANIRNVMQFLIAPEYFEPILSQSMKVGIRNGFADHMDLSNSDDPVDIDRDLYAIRNALSKEVEGHFNFWQSGIVERWKPEKESTPEGDELEEGTSYWVYAPGAQARLWDEFREQGIIGLGWDELGDFSQYSTRDAVRQALKQHNDGKASVPETLAVWQFQKEMKPGDVIYVKRGRSQILGRGTVASAARFDAARSEYRNVRDVKWEHVGEWESPQHLPMKTLTNSTDKRGLVEALEALFDLSVEHAVPRAADVPDYGEQEFLAEVYFEEEQLARLVSLLRRKKNVILSGPPGVGKTYVARRLAYVMMGAKDKARIEQVQFHQSYSYEDFMMGFRPTESGGYKLLTGAFYDFCARAKEEPDREYFFIIDEINRGNVSKIFGELLMLIEADKRGTGVRLVYNDEIFSVPANLHIIATMNTADRSLVTIDYALRRRFGFFSLAPAFGSSGFQSWMAEQGNELLEALVGVIAGLNEQISTDSRLGPGFAIGHSYVAAAPQVDEEDDWLYSVVEDDLIPLIEEYWFDDPELVGEWAQRLRAAVS